MSKDIALEELEGQLVWVDNLRANIENRIKRYKAKKDKELLLQEGIDIRMTKEEATHVRDMTWLTLFDDLANRIDAALKEGDND